MDKSKNKVRRFGVQLKLSVLIGLLLLIVCVVIGLNLYSRVKAGMIDMGVQEAEMAARVACSVVDGDELSSIRAGSEGSQQYKNILASLREIQETCGITFIYTLYTDDNVTLHYGVDTDTSAGHRNPGDMYKYSYSQYESIFKGENYVQRYIDHTEDGDLISAYMPIYNSKGAVVGVLGCDYDADYVQSKLNSVRNSIIWIAAICLIISFVVLNLVISSIMRSLKKVNSKIYDIVHNEGDLTQKLDIHSGDEMELIAGNVNTLLEHIRGIMLNISRNSTQLGESTGTVVQSLVSAKDSIADVSATMEEMSAAMEETNSSLCQVNESVTSIEDTVISIANRASDESAGAYDTSRRVVEIYNKAEKERDDAKKQARDMSQSVNEKIESSKAVEKIDALTGEILNITDQTSLLALNASIEAARAGEAGRGFAVVAGEIGSLAANSAKAAEEIQKVSQEVIEAVNALADEAENMIKFMNDTAMAGYEKLLSNSKSYQNDVEHLSSTMQEFAAGSEELRDTISNIKEAVGAVNIAVEESTKGIVNVTEVASDMTERMRMINEEADANEKVAEQLSLEVGKFKL
ncbi:MAG: methyl-accepting chemotaxis protein [Bacteroides sp.]